MALGVILGDPNSVAKAINDLKIELDKEKAAREIAQAKVDMLTRVVRDLKISVEKVASQIPTFEEKIKHLENKVVDGLNKVHARELRLERTTNANDDYQRQNAQLASKLESKFH
jgi:archaellum component FlaC